MHRWQEVHDMAIVKHDPDNWHDANVVLVDSDAKDNKEALHEIEDWAADNGFARTREYWLQQIRRDDGERVFRGICYRLTEEVRRSHAEKAQELAESVQQMPLTHPPAMSDH
jgi:hypothetical protein